MKAIRVLSAVICALIIMSITSCKNRNSTDDQTLILHPDTLKDHFDYAHIALGEREEKIIDQYVMRHEWRMVKTTTGLRYVVYREGSGKRPERGDVVKFNFELKLINGIFVTSSEEEGPQHVMIGHDDVVSGLHEALQYMNSGARAKVIVPSYLAYGLTGDQDRIPKGATLIYDIEIIDITSVK